MLDIYIANTPNGQKVLIALHELGLEYRLHRLNLGQLDQKKPEYLLINPNGRIPALVDQERQNFAVFESGAILIYLAEKTSKLLSMDVEERSRVFQWLMFQVSALGPIMGQAGWFLRSAEQRMPLGIQRFQNETIRLYGVLESQLSRFEYLGGSDYSIADISTWTWARRPEYAEISDHSFPNVRRWVKQIEQRKAVQSAMFEISKF